MKAHSPVTMIDEDSILRRVPTCLDRKSALFLDGIRHSVEIQDLAYGRLRSNLTHAALTPPTSAQLPKLAATVFLDAWAVVDAVDRFRMLYTQMPGMRFSPAPAGTVTLDEATKPFRDLRNVADHLSQRADFVISRGGAALGTLTWMTGFQTDPVAAWFCSIRPGTLHAPPVLRTEPVETTLDWPTDRICLSAGGYEGNLSALRPHIYRRVAHLEAQLRGAFEKMGGASLAAASDVFTRHAVLPVPSSASDDG